MSEKPRRAAARLIDPDRAKSALERSEKRWLALAGLRIREARNADGLSVFDLARKANVCANTLNLCERGARPPALWLLYRVAKALGRDPSELLP